jgi:hypothetical protein
MLSERQKEAVDKLQGKSGIIWWKIGEGKTRIALNWAVNFLEPDSRVLIICSPSAFRQWQDEAEELSFNKEQLRFLSFGALTSKYWKFDVERQLTGVNCIIVDELWLFKNCKAKRTKELHALATRLPALGLSGSMVTARNVEDIYGQAFAVGISVHISRSLTAFRTEF